MGGPAHYIIEKFGVNITYQLTNPLETWRWRLDFGDQQIGTSLVDSNAPWNPVSTNCTHEETSCTVGIAAL